MKNTPCNLITKIGDFLTLVIKCYDDIKFQTSPVHRNATPGATVSPSCTSRRSASAWKRSRTFGSDAAASVVFSPRTQRDVGNSEKQKRGWALAPPPNVVGLGQVEPNRPRGHFQGEQIQVNRRGGDNDSRRGQRYRGRRR